MNFKKNQSLFNLFDSLFSDKEKYESFYNQITNKLTPSLGSTKTESGVNEDGSKWYKTTFTSNDGSYTSSSYVSSTNFNDNWYSTSTNNVETPSELHTLQNKLEEAISTQNFEDAVKYRDLIKNYEKVSEKLTTLNSQLEEAISTQNFEEAIKLRDSIKKLETK
jgi:excinuclease UvrABC helicase subunit UvrB